MTSVSPCSCHAFPCARSSSSRSHGSGSRRLCARAQRRSARLCARSLFLPLTDDEDERSVLGLNTILEQRANARVDFLLDHDERSATAAKAAAAEAADECGGGARTMR